MSVVKPSGILSLHNVGFGMVRLILKIPVFTLKKWFSLILDFINVKLQILLEFLCRIFGSEAKVSFCGRKIVFTPSTTSYWKLKLGRKLIFLLTQSALIILCGA